jgi:hypothetical protein
VAVQQEFWRRLRAAKTLVSLNFELCMPQNYLVLIGSENPSFGATTHGTGFLVMKKEDVYVVTCRHVIREAVGGRLFALPNPKRTKNPPDGYSVLILGSPRFHAKDNQAGTYDIALAQVPDVTQRMLAAQSIVPIEMTSSHVVDAFREGEEFIAQGYPIDYANVALAKDSNEPLLPRQIRGTLRNVPLQGIRQQGFDAPLREALFAQTDTANRSGKGMSGSIVHSTQSYQVAGIVLASGDLQRSIQDITIETLEGFIFARAGRIIEAIND